MQHKDVPIKDVCILSINSFPANLIKIYATRTQSETRRNQKLPSPASDIPSPPTIGAVFSPPVQEQRMIPDIVPMRRGRPATTTSTPSNQTPKPSPSPMRGVKSDPFAALDSKSLPSAPQDEIATRFPPIDQFALLHDQGNKFEFSPSPTTATASKNLNQRVTERLADDAFVSPPQPKPMATPLTNPSLSGPSKASQIISTHPALQAPPSDIRSTARPFTPIQPSMVSQGTMTSPEMASPPESKPSKQSSAPIYRFPPKSDLHRSSSLPRDRTTRSYGDTRNSMDQTTVKPPGVPKNIVSRVQPDDVKVASSSRPSLEGGRPTIDQLDQASKPKSAESRARPASTNLESNLEYLREKESANSRPGFLKGAPPSLPKASEYVVEVEPESEESGDVDFLRSMEDQDASRWKDRRSSGEIKQPKRSSMNSTLSSTKALFAGKFGDAFKRFETTTVPPPPRTPSPLKALDRRELTPIASSEATDDRSEDGLLINEDRDNLTPEERREHERRRLSLEEKRVEAAKAEYRQRLDARDATGLPPPPRSIGGHSKAASIQNKVKTLLDETQKPSSVKTAEGYGRYTDTPSTSSIPSRALDDRPQPNPKPILTRKPVIPPSQQPTATHPHALHQIHSAPQLHAQAQSQGMVFRQSQPPLPTTSATIPIPAARSTGASGPRPSAPPKPSHLSSSPPKSSATTIPLTRPTYPHPNMTAQEKEDYVSDFSRRFPSLSGIEYVETVVGVGGGANRDEVEGRSREV